MKNWIKLLIFSYSLLFFLSGATVFAHESQILYSTILSAHQSVAGIRGYNQTNVLCAGSAQDA